MLYSNQKWFCTNCGKEQNSPMSVGRYNGSQCVGHEWKCCSVECHREIEWKRVLSIMGKEYYPKPDEEMLSY